MGLYDEFDILPPDDDRFRCSAGHPVASLQTKELGQPTMERHLLHRDRLYAVKRRERHELPIEIAGALLLRADSPAVPSTHTGGARVYGYCEQCLPVLYLSGNESPSWDLVRDRRPFCEWTVVFAGGALVDVAPVRVESRDDVKRDLERHGVDVLADDDRLAKRWFAVEAARERDEPDW
jgi:hypothetical protein